MKLLVVTFASAVVLFVWGAVTLLMVPGHDAVMLAARDEAALLQALEQHAGDGGVYAVPVNHASYTATSPFAMIMYRPGGMGFEPGAVMAVSFVTSWLAALVAAMLLRATTGLSFAGRVAFVAGLGTFAAFVTHLPNWTWMGYSAGYTAMAIFDLLVGWLLAGLVLARWAPRTA